MREAELSAEQKHQLYERLMVAIFGERQDPRLPLCYPYIIEDGEEVSLEEGVKRVLETLLDLPIFPGLYKIQWTKEKQIQLLNLRFGLEDGETRRLAKVGKEFEITRERVRQVEARILRVLRHPSRSGYLRNFLIPSPEERTAVLQLEEENKKLREENERFQRFSNRFGIPPEEFESRYKIEQTRSNLRKALQKAASRYPGITPYLITNTYNALVRSEINSLSQLKAVMNLGEWRVVELRQIGEKSFWLIHKTLEISEEETK